MGDNMGRVGVRSTDVKLSFRDKYGFPIALIFLALFSWFFISSDLYREPFFSLLYPPHWLLMFPFGDIVLGFLQSFAVYAWWMWVEAFIMFLSWLVLFFLLRGFISFLSVVEGLSMWQMFVICLGLGFVFLVFIILPVMDQLEIWWQAWPEITRPHVPGS